MSASAHTSLLFALVICLSALLILSLIYVTNLSIKRNRTLLGDSNNTRDVEANRVSVQTQPSDNEPISGSDLKPEIDYLPKIRSHSSSERAEDWLERRTTIATKDAALRDWGLDKSNTSRMDAVDIARARRS